jgi:FlaA1/EpsC-like NDP-sugar epimerase
MSEHSVLSMFQKKPKRIAIVMDEIDGMNSGDKGGIKVFGALDSLADALATVPATHAIIAMPSASHHDRKRAADLATAAGLQVLTVPSFDDLVSGKVTVSQIRAVELDDLLGRDPVVLDSDGLKGWIADRVVMVTGAGGSIGSELCRQIARFGPRLLVMVDSSEFSLYQIEQEFAGKVRIVAIAGDVRSPVRMAQVLSRYRPTVVLHAAAYKHVPLMETDNCAEAVLNNVAGTWSVARAAVDAGVEKFVLVSTDKAVNPTNVMGATKRLAEIVCERLQETTTGTRFVMVRFGNVLGSAGSVIPRFRDQIAAGGPVTVTHPEITRFFMSIPEAAQLVLQAGLMGKGGEIFVLDMGEPVRIADLARSMIRLSGFSEDEIRIVYSGLRPGEKLFEELLADDEQTLPTPHPKLRIAQARQAPGDFLPRLHAWIEALQAGRADDAWVKRELAVFVPEYHPQGAAAEAAPGPEHANVAR